jgi:hypothetical protein
MRQLHLALILPCILISFPAPAEQTSIKSQSQGVVTFVSGGVGIDEKNEMEALQAGYNLSLLFSTKGRGEYISDVKVHIEDSNGKICLETVTDGPMLYAQLKPGRYSISADWGGHVIDKKVMIGGKRASLSLVWTED